MPFVPCGTLAFHRRLPMADPKQTSISKRERCSAHSPRRNDVLTCYTTRCAVCRDTYICGCVYICIHTYIYMYVCMYVKIYLCIYVFIFIYIRMYVDLYRYRCSARSLRRSDAQICYTTRCALAPYTDTDIDACVCVNM